MLEQYLASMQEINKATTTSLENVLEGNAKSLQLHAGDFNLRNILVDPTTEPYLVDEIAAYRDVNPNVLNSFVPRFYVSTSKSIIKALINMRSFEIQLSPIG